MDTKPIESTGRQNDTKIKCVVWDLDNTLWNGILSEGGATALRPEIRRVLELLDERGILHSVASRNEHDPAMARLTDLGVDEYFLYPQISWGNKSTAITQIASELNIATNTIAFIDDDPFERDEVASVHPDVLCIDASQADDLPGMARMRPRFVTTDSASRREKYLAEIERQEQAKQMTPGEFLRSLDMVFTIEEAGPTDLERIEELTVRTNQLNSTGVTYTFSELDAFRESHDHLLLVASLDDRYGDYGKIGIAVVDRSRKKWHILLLLMSCRVMSRGVGKVLLSHVLQLAADEDKHVVADFVHTESNRAMFITLKLAGFRGVDGSGDTIRLVHDLSMIDAVPDYIDLRIVT